MSKKTQNVCDLYSNLMRIQLTVLKNSVVICYKEDRQWCGFSPLAASILLELSVAQSTEYRSEPADTAGGEKTNQLWSSLYYVHNSSIAFFTSRQNSCKIGRRIIGAAHFYFIYYSGPTSCNADKMVVFFRWLLRNFQCAPFVWLIPACAQV